MGSKNSRESWACGPGNGGAHWTHEWVPAFARWGIGVLGFLEAGGLLEARRD